MKTCATPARWASPTSSSPAPVWADRGFLEFDQLLRLRKLIESQGLEVCAIENLPRDHWEDVILAGPERDAQLANVCTTIRNMGRAGWPALGYYFSIAGVWGHWRAYTAGGGRGGAGLKSFDRAQVADAPDHEAAPVSVDEMWDRLADFLDLGLRLDMGVATTRKSSLPRSARWNACWQRNFPPGGPLCSSGDRGREKKTMGTAR